MNTLKDLSFNIFEKHSHKYPFSKLAFPIQRRLFNLKKEKFDKVILQLNNISDEFNRKLENNDNIPFCVNPGYVKHSQVSASCNIITPFFIINNEGEYKIKLALHSEIDGELYFWGCFCNESDESEDEGKKDL